MKDQKSPLVNGFDRDYEVVTLPDGRDISVNIYGDESGYPIFYFNGLPGSRLEGKIFHKPALELGAKIISVDRPGAGYSSPNPKRTILSDAGDIRHIAKAFDATKYSIIGISAGGTYAMACAHQHPSDALRAVALVSSTGPYDIDFHGKMRGNRVLFWCCRNAPWLVRLIGSIAMRQLRYSDEQLLEKVQSRARKAKSLYKEDELALNSEVTLMLIANAREAFRQGRQGIESFIQDGRLLSSSLGFRYQDIRTPVRMWYGGQDKNQPTEIGRTIYSLLRKESTEMMVVEDEGHMSLPINCGRQILKDLLEHSR